MAADHALHFHRQRSTRSARSDSLVMTDYGFLLALALAIVIAVDPLEVELERDIYIKHLPLLIMLPCLMLSVVAARVFRREEKPVSVLPPLLPLLLLAAFVIAGGIAARFFAGIQNSFLVAGIYMLCAPAAAAILVRCDQPEKLLRAYAFLLGAAALVVTFGLAQNYGVRQVYHELEYLFPTLAVLFAFKFPGGWRRWAGIGFFLLIGVLHKKNTGYIVTLIALAYIVALETWPRWRRGDALKRLTKTHWLLIAALALGGLIAFLVANREQYLPTGNPGFRMFTYERAWNRFLDSPLWGTGFAAPAAEEFSVFEIAVQNNVLPTHSDVLDIFANGGLLGVALWLWMLVRVARVAWRDALNPSRLGHALAPYAHLMACTSIAAVATYCFNPILLQPAKSLLLWTDLGFLVAIACCMRQGGQGVPSERRPASNPNAERRDSLHRAPDMPRDGRLAAVNATSDRRPHVVHKAP